MAISFDKKYLSIFLDKFVPKIFKDQYPLYAKFIEYFLEYFEQKNGIYYNIANFIDYVDVDKIADLKNSTDPNEQELGNILINQLYEQMVGTKGAQYLSELLDEILFLKKQKSIFRYKGTKYAFLFFFLIIFGGYFKILNITSQTKIHNGVFQYNGIITYNSSDDINDAFVYLVLSEFYPAQYEKILNVLNPAGMLPVKFYTKLKYITDTMSDINTIFSMPNTYAIIYDNDTRIGMLKISKFGAYEQVTPEQTYDVELLDNTFWRNVPISTGVTNLYYDILFNTFLFGELNFNRIKLVSNPTPNVNYSYTDINILSEGTILYDEYLTDNIISTGMYETFPIVTNTKVSLMVNF